MSAGRFGGEQVWRGGGRRRKESEDSTARNSVGYERVDSSGVVVMYVTEKGRRWAKRKTLAVVLDVGLRGQCPFVATSLGCELGDPERLLGASGASAATLFWSYRHSHPIIILLL